MLNPDQDPLYVAARRVLLDACDALGKLRDAMVLVGAQAIYLQASDVGLDVVSPFTSDADLSIDPARLDSAPAIVEAMNNAGFKLKIKAGGNGVEPGAWQIIVDVGGDPTPIEVDLMVPESVAPGRGRDAKLPAHGKNASRIGPGLEASVIDHHQMTIASLEPHRDTRTTILRVAGTAALLIAKAHKIGERVDEGKEYRIKPKDAGDVFRLMRSPMPPDAVGARLAELRRNPMCGASVETGIDYLKRLFGNERAPGVDLAVENLVSAVTEDELRVVMPDYMDAVLEAYRQTRS